MITNVYQIRKIVITDYYILLIELLIGLGVVFFYPQLPLRVLLIAIGSGLFINIVLHVCLAYRTSIFLLQPLIILEMIVAVIMMTLVCHYFTDLRPIIISVYLPIIIFSNILSLNNGISTILVVLLSYNVLYNLEISRLYPIPYEILKNTQNSNWQEVSFFAIGLVILNGALISYLKFLSTHDVLRISWPDWKSHQNIIKDELTDRDNSELDNKR